MKTFAKLYATQAAEFTERLKTETNGAKIVWLRHMQARALRLAAEFGGSL